MLADEIRILVAAFEILVAMLIFLLIYLMGRKAVEIRSRKKVDHCKNKINDKILHAIFTGDLQRSLRVDTIVKKTALEELLSHYAEILEGTREMNNLKTLAQSRLTGYYRKNLRSVKWSTRMNALFHIEALEVIELEEDLLWLLQRSRVSKEEKIRTLNILAQFQSGAMFDLLTKEYSELSHLEYRSILSRLKGKSFDVFLLGYHSCSEQLKFALLDLTGLTKELKYTNFVETVFSVSSGEERVRALKALCVIGHVRDLERYLPMFESENWEERMLIARLAGALKAETAMPSLLKLLHDQSWWVRYQAARSIMMFPGGQRQLRDVIHSSQDPFARDMALEWINKGV